MCSIAASQKPARRTELNDHTTKIKRLPGRGPLFRYLFKSQDMLLPPPFAPAKNTYSIAQILPSAFKALYFAIPSFIARR